MKEKKTTDSNNPRGLRIKVTFEGTPDKDIKVVAYAFDRQGKFLDSSPLKEDVASLQIDGEQAAHARIFLAPPIPKDEKNQTATLKLMRRMRAYEPVWKYRADVSMQELLPIPETLWPIWRWCRCRVRGQVVRPVEYDSTTEDMPVCHARVHICEVDPLIIILPRLPDDIIFRLRDDLIRAIERPPFKFPRPLPDPPPFKYNPGVIDPSPEAIADMNRAQSIPPETMSAVDTFAQKTISISNPTMIAGLGPQPEPPDYPQRLETISLNTKSALMSSSATVVRRTLLEERALIYPYICLWPWFWPLYKCDEIDVLETDNQGRFDSLFWYLCAGDHPDLYFWVEYFIGGSWTTVYKPPLPCNIYWNYTCDNEVILRVLDPRVPWCDDTVTLAGKQVAVLTIGNNVSIPEIQDSSAGDNEGLTTDGRPFGGRLEPHVWFGEDLIASGITHYCWSYKRLTEGDGTTAVTDDWHVMDRQVVRHYAVIDPTPPDFPLSFKPYVLGPEKVVSTDNLFQIQPKNPPVGSSGWAPMVDARENTASAFFLSHLLEGGDAMAGAGKYELKLELFDNAGNVVNLDSAGVLLKIPTGNAPFGPGEVETAVASDEYRIRQSGDTVAFRLVIRVDNNPCTAEIYTISGAGLTVNANCGFVQYQPGADAHITFKAKHPNGFANFRFRIHRGTGIYIAEAAATGLVSDLLVNGYVRNPSYVYSKDIPVTTLLTSNTPAGETPCTKAAFAETLDVDALATDGWSGHLWYLDHTATPVAFALEPDES